MKILLKLFFLLLPVFGTEKCVGLTFNLGPELEHMLPPVFFQFKSNPNNRQGHAPLICCDTIRTIANWVIDETCTPIDTAKMQPGDIVFVHCLLLDQFIELVSPHINTPYILFTADHDPDVMSAPSHLQLLKNPNLVLWATINCMLPSHPKSIPLPLGIFPNHPLTDAINRYGDAIKHSKQKKKNILCIVNFLSSTWTHPDRIRVIEDLKNFSFITFEKHHPINEYLEHLMNSTYCICPRGNGWDCYRNWETLLLGSIPIMEHSVLDPLFYDLPVLIIDSYKSLSEKFLSDELVRIKNGTYNYKKLNSDYWTSFLLKMQKHIRRGHDITRKVKTFKKRTYGNKL